MQQLRAKVSKYSVTQVIDSRNTFAEWLT